MNQMTNILPNSNFRPIPLGLTIGPFHAIFNAPAQTASAPAPPVGLAFPEVFAHSSGTSSAVFTPPETQVGDFMLVHIAADSYSYVPMVSGAAGWTFAAAYDNAPATVLYWKFAESEDLGNYHTFQGGAAASTIINLVCISGVNTSDPIHTINIESDTTNQAASFDPNSTTYRQVGRVDFTTAYGPRAISTKYDKSLVVGAFSLDAGSIRNDQDTSGFQHVYKQNRLNQVCAAMGSYKMEAPGVSPAWTIGLMTSDIVTGLTAVINPATLETNNLPTTPYIASYSTKYLPSLSQGLIFQAPSGIEAGDLLVCVTFIGSNGGLVTPTCIDNLASDSWTRNIYSPAVGAHQWSVWSKVAEGGETSVTFDSNTNSYQAGVVYRIPNATSGVLVGASTSGYTPNLSSSEIFGPAVGVHADGTLVLHGVGSKGAGDNNISSAWTYLALPSPDQPSQIGKSGLFVHSSFGNSSSVGMAMAQEFNATGSGVHAPRWRCQASQAHSALAFSVF